MIATDFPPRLREAVDQQLAEGEVLVWLEQPDPGEFNNLTSYLLMLFGLLMAVTGLFVKDSGRPIS